MEMQENLRVLSRTLYKLHPNPFTWINCILDRSRFPVRMSAKFLIWSLFLMFWYIITRACFTILDIFTISQQSTLEKDLENHMGKLKTPELLGVFK